MKTLTLKYHKNANIQAKLLAKFLDTDGVELEFTPENNDFAPDFEMDAKLQRRFDTDQDLNYYGVSPLWFSAKVEIKYKGYEATDYLGGCCYNSYKEFKQDPYYFDMINTCIDQINADITAHNDGICKAFKLRNLKRSAGELGLMLIPKTAVI